MDDRQQDEIQESVSVAPKADWSRPEVNKLLTGGAEAAGDTRTDGIDILS